MVVLLLASSLAVATRPAEAAACPCTVFGSTVPSNPDNGPDSAVLLGTAFKTEIAGYVTGMRFYKAAANTGVHDGHLFESNGAGGFGLAEVTFTGESASGWQTATFAKPVWVFPGKTYVVAYTALNGHYSRDSNFFTSPVVNGPLTAIGSNYDYNPNALLNYGPVTANYYVDVVFQTDIGAQSLFGRTPVEPQVPVAPLFTGDVGTRFYSDINTKVTGVRYWLNAAWFQSINVFLWKSDGTQLATTSHPDVDMPTGWTEVFFDSPVDIVAGDEYVVSLHISGYYGYTSNYFAAPYSRGPFHAPVNAGVSIGGSSPAFPTTQSADNYWIDPLFSSDAIGSIGGVVDPTLNFAVAGRASACNGQTSSGFQTGSTATAVGLGHLNSSIIGGGAQDLTLSTNAANGFSVYIRTNGTTPSVLRTSGGSTIADVTGTHVSPSASTSAGTAGFGYTTNDASIAFGANKWAALTTTDETVMTAAPGTLSKTTCTGFQATVTGTTPAGTYTAPVIYTAVPTF